MPEIKRGRGRPATSKLRQELALRTFLVVLLEEGAVYNRRTPRGKTFMTRSMNDLYIQVAAEFGVSPSWVRRGWKQFYAATKQGIIDDLVRQLNTRDLIDARRDAKRRARDAQPAVLPRRKRVT